MSTNEKTHWRVVTPATWPAPPAVMSVSTYAEIEECPRRWALSSAEYPELWGGRGYPPKLKSLRWLVASSTWRSRSS